MDWTWIATLFPVAVRLEPVIAKYGPAAFALYKADAPQAMLMIGDIAAALNGGNPVAYINLVVKWGPMLAAFIKTEEPQFQQAFKDIEAAIGDSSTIPVIASPVAPAPVSSGSVVFPPA
jgi:hypothetical protein